MGAGAKRADADLPLSPLTSFISGFAYNQCMGRLKQIKTNLSGAPRAIALMTLGPLEMKSMLPPSSAILATAAVMTIRRVLRMPRSLARFARVATVDGHARLDAGAGRGQMLPSKGVRLLLEPVWLPGVDCGFDCRHRTAPAVDA